MYKSICVVAVLLAAFAFMSGSKPAGASAPTSYASPQIVAKGKLPNQTSTIPTTTIFTPIQTGLYRLTVYMTIGHPDTSGSHGGWEYNLNWSDDGGAETVELLDIFGSQAPPYAYGYTGWDAPGPVLTFEALAGSPITYSVGQINGSTTAAYSLYYTLERLE